MLKVKILFKLHFRVDAETISYQHKKDANLFFNPSLTPEFLLFLQYGYLSWWCKENSGQWQEKSLK